MPGSIFRLIAICALATAGCLSGPTHTVTGLVDLVDSTGAGIAVTGSTCKGIGTYLEYGPGTQVTVGGANGSVSGTLSAGEARSSTDCRFTFAVPGVPDSPAYEVSIGPNGGGPPLPGPELAADNWVYAVTIGS
jgi:hypothetical protein